MLPAEELHPGADSVHQNNQGSLHLYISSDISSVGNILIIVVVHKRKELRKTVNFFIANMAASDMTFPLIYMPIIISNEATGSLEWNVRGMAGLILCKLAFFLQHISLAV